MNAPGSAKARRMGCICPVIENGYGDGIDEFNKRQKPAPMGAIKIEWNRAKFWVALECEEHEPLRTSCRRL